MSNAAPNVGAARPAIPIAVEAVNAVKDLTPNQRKVFEVLQQAEAPLGAYTILRRAGFRGATQVYRALEGLADQGLVRKLESLNAYIACSIACQSAPTAFAICDQCGLIQEVADAREIKQFQEYLAQSNFHVSRTVVEFHGVCSSCSDRSHAKEKPPTSI